MLFDDSDKKIMLIHYYFIYFFSHLDMLLFAVEVLV